MSDVAALLAQLTGNAPQPASDPAMAAIRLARASIDALVLRMGESIEARVVGQLAGGLTQLSAGSEAFVLKLPTPLPEGAAVTIRMQPVPDGQPAVTVRLATPMPLPGPAATPAMPRPANIIAATSVIVAPAASAPVAGPAVPIPQPPAAVPQPQPSSPPGPATPAQPLRQAPAASIQPQPAPQALPSQPAAPLPGAGPQPPPPVLTQTIVQPTASPLPPATPTAIAPAANPPAAAPLPVPTTTPPALPAAAGAAIPALATPQPGPQVVVLATPAPVPQVVVTAASPLPQTPVVPPAPPVAPPTPAIPAAPPVAASPAVAVPAPPPAVVAPQPPGVGSPPQAQAAPLPIAQSAAPAASAPLNLTDLGQVAARQDSVAPLLARLSAVVAQGAALPRPIVEVALKLLASRVDLNRAPPDGVTLRDAVLGAGVLASVAGARAASTARDNLLQLRSGLLALLGGDADTGAPVAGRRAVLPLRGEPPRAPLPQAPASVDQSLTDPPKTLLAHTDAALSRLKLLQLASQPADAARPEAQAAKPELRVEIPMLLGAETAILQLQVERDARHRPNRRERAWRMRFAVNFSATGEIGAEVTLFGRTTSVSVWAADADTADAIEAMLPDLSPALARHGLDVGAVRVRRAPAPRPHSPGQLLDSAR